MNRKTLIVCSRPRLGAAPRTRLPVVPIMAALFVMPSFCCAQQGTGAGTEAPAALDAAAREAVIDAVTSKVEELYVFPDVGKKICEQMRSRQRDGAYARIESLDELTRQITRDLQSASSDKHIGVLVLDERLAGSHHVATEDDDEWWEQYLAETRRTNFGFARAECLGGNVGYLKLTSFEFPRAAGPTAVGAMSFLANCEALIVDVRDNYGGRDEMIQLLLSYLFEDAVHFATKIHRDRDAQQQRWTIPFVPGRKLVEIPLYVLVGRDTVSGGEAFAYFLQSLKRATVIGENTVGAAHMTHPHPLPDLGIVVFVPDGTTTCPATGTDWNGTGVKPDISVPADQALRVAHIEALKLGLRGETDEKARFDKEWLLRGLEASQDPITLSDTQLKEYVGSFGDRRFRVEEGRLIYQRGGRSEFFMIPLGEDLFRLEGLEPDYLRFQFNRDKTGAITEVVALYDDRNREAIRRTGK
ncbi:MAG: S41 family peptidase [Phycisphaerales bacterium]|nr:MAG: S41 family peptidase [Phycisphaerales bacterium]